MHFIPPRPFLDAVVARAVATWLFTRAFTAAEAVSGGGDLVRGALGHPVTALWVMLVVLVVVRVEMWRHHELVFLANLGISFGHVAALVVTLCVVLETLTRSLVG